MEIEGKYYFEDVESGELIPVDKATYDMRIAFRERLIKEMQDAIVGKLISFGTGGDFDTDVKFKDLWKK